MHHKCMASIPVWEMWQSNVEPECGAFRDQVQDVSAPPSSSFAGPDGTETTGATHRSPSGRI